MTFTRRTTLLGIGAALAFPMPAIAKSAARDYTITFGKSRVGSSSLSVKTKGSQVTAKYSITTKANLLVVKYAYGLEATEIWENGRLVSLKSTAFENKKKFSVSGKAVSGGFKVDGTLFKGVIKGNPGTTSYWSPEVLKRKTWISSQSGRPLNVTVKKRRGETIAAPAGNVECAVYKCTGLKRDMELYYDLRGEWVGNEVRAFGGAARLLANGLNPAFAGYFNA